MARVQENGERLLASAGLREDRHAFSPHLLATRLALFLSVSSTKRALRIVRSFSMAAFSIPQIHHALCSVCHQALLPLAGYMDLVSFAHAFLASFTVPSRHRKSLAQLAEATTIVCAYSTLLAATCRVPPCVLGFLPCSLALVVFKCTPQCVLRLLVSCTCRPPCPRLLLRWKHTPRGG